MSKVIITINIILLLFLALPANAEIQNIQKFDDQLQEWQRAINQLETMKWRQENIRNSINRLNRDRNQTSNNFSQLFDYNIFGSQNLSSSMMDNLDRFWDEVRY